MPGALAKATGGARVVAVWTAGRIQAVVARISFSMLEGWAFAFSRPSAIAVGIAELAALAYFAGVKTPFRVAAGTALAMGTLRTWHCLFTSFRATGLTPHAMEELQSIWEWEPPKGDAGASGAWHVLRQLAVTANKVKQENPGIARLLDQPQLAANELATRLFYFYSAQDQPLLSEQQLVALAAEGADGQAVAREGDDWVAPVPADLKRQLNHYRDMACLAYDYNTDETLREQLAERGFTLLCASYVADLDSGCPAYFLCISEDEGEVALVIRGTFSAEDAFFDLLANGAPFDDGEVVCRVEPSGENSGPTADRPLRGYCHCGMGRAAAYLGEKFGPLLLPLYQQGLRVTLVGHSLGAGVASLLAVYLWNRGVGPDRLHCWAFETPACMDLQLAKACTAMVTSLVNCDDCVPRLCIRSFAGLLEELAAFDWEAEAARHAERGASAMTAHLSKLLLYAFGTAGQDGKEGGKEDGEKGDKAASKAGGKENGKQDSSSGGRDGQEVNGRREASGSGGKGGERVDKEHVGEAADEALHEAALAAGEADLRRLGSDGFERSYNAHVPGRVCLVFRPSRADAGHSADDKTDEAGQAGTEGDGGSAGKSSGSEGGAALPKDGLALVPCTHPAVRRLRVSSFMLTDHFVDKPEVMAALAD
ncbi:hypothetical protein ABPG77_001878 [Micractinium sp. CCAP 211/92]